MNIFLRQALQGIIKLIIGYDKWGKVKDAVMSVTDTELTGEEKKSVVVAQLKETGINLATSFLNLAIEVAVALVTKKLIEISDKAGE